MPCKNVSTNLEMIELKITRHDSMPEREKTRIVVSLIDIQELSHRAFRSCHDGPEIVLIAAGWASEI